MNTATPKIVAQWIREDLANFPEHVDTATSVAYRLAVVRTIAYFRDAPKEKSFDDLVLELLAQEAGK